MDWLSSMNTVIKHIEANLTKSIIYEALSKMAGCSMYEFSRIFSFMTGISISEYIRRRRLTQAAFELQNGKDKIIDIAARYCYESQASFSRAFKELHGVTPMSARKSGVSLKSYHPISFTLTIKGMNELMFKMVKMDAFGVIGLTVFLAVEDTLESFPSLWNSSVLEIPELPEGKEWYDFEGDNPSKFKWEEIEDTKTKWVFGWDKEEEFTIYCTAIIEYALFGEKLKATVGFMEQDIDKNKLVNINPYITVPAADWIVFSFYNERDSNSISQAYTRINTEWLPGSGYLRNENFPHIERFPVGANIENLPWEIWIPITVL